MFNSVKFNKIFTYTVDVIKRYAILTYIKEGFVKGFLLGYTQFRV
jgi:hypothetical protein